MAGVHQDTAVVIDSSGWLEYFADGPNAGEIAAAIESADPLVVPTLALFEVYKRLHLQRGEEVALQAVNAMQDGLVAGLAEGAHGFESAEDPDDAVVFAGVGDGVDVGAGGDSREGRI